MPVVGTTEMNRILLIYLMSLLIIAGCNTGPSADKPVILTKLQFQNAFIETLKRIDSDMVVQTKGELHLQVEIGEDDHFVFLDNAYQEYSSAPTDLDEVLNRFAQSVIESQKQEETIELDPTRVVPVIKDAQYLQEVKQSLVDAGQDISKLNYYYEELNPRLHIFYALDTEFNIRYLSKEDIETLQIPFGELRERAISNLKKILPPIELRGGDGFFMLMAGGTYESSLLLLDTLWDKSQIPVKGDYVICIPSRDLFFITGMKDTKNLQRVRAACEEAVENSSYHLSSDLFVRMNQSWKYMDQQSKP